MDYMTRLPEDHSGAHSDEHLIQLWLSGRPPSTVKSYRHSAKDFLKALPSSLPELTLADVVAWRDSLEGSDGYKTKRIMVVRSLLRFAHEAGYCVFNVGLVLRTPPRQTALHERIVEPSTIMSMIAKATFGRDRTFLKFLYGSAARVSEAVGLNWIDLGKGVVTFRGKGGKVRTVPVPASVFAELLALRPKGAKKHDPVFRSLRGRRLGIRDAQRIVTAARTDVAGVSPHWMRHAHATHTLDKGAQLHKLQRQLGHTNISTTGVYLHVRGGEGTADLLDL